MTISAAKIKQLIERAEAGQITDSDLDAFFKDPGLWHERLESGSHLLMPQDAQNFWQGVWDELLGKGKVTVPPVPKLTEKQVKSLERFRFLLMYLPAITEDEYPKSFRRPGWSSFLNVHDSKIEHKPLMSTWIAVETIKKPGPTDPKGYLDDRLMAAVKRGRRLAVTSHDDLTGSLLQKIAKVTGFPKKGTRLPTAEELNLVGNLFGWLRYHRGIFLPNFDWTCTMEWCENTYGTGQRLLAGGDGYDSLTKVNYAGRGCRDPLIGFRVLVVL